MSLRIPSRTDFAILHENPDWLVVGKPAPLVVHPSSGSTEVTLWDLLRQSRPRQEFFLVNRLDRETSGCVLVARCAMAARALGRAFSRGGVTKEYLALVHGWPEWDERCVETGLRRKGEFTCSEIWVRQAVHPEGKRSITRFVVERRWESDLGKFSQVRCFPETGRTHQIRVHLEWAGHGIVGDKIYGRNDSAYLRFLGEGWSEDLADELILARQALHAVRLRFPWKESWVVVECEPPGDLATFGIA
jgi:23S rRNA pseudouridine1911/1915/1917 synthase